VPLQPPSQQPSQQPPPPQQPPSNLAHELRVDTPSRNFTRGVANRDIRGIVLHSADGASQQGDLSELTTGSRGASAHYYITRDGKVHHLVADDDIAHHAGVMNIDPAHFGNAASIGIEQEHVDGKDDWPDAQVRRTAIIVSHILQSHPNLTLNDVMGHSDVAPGHKVDPVNYPWAKFRDYVASFMGGSVAGTPHHGRYAEAATEPSARLIALD